MHGIHRSSVNSPPKGQWHGALMFSLIWAWINRWVKNREAGNLRRHRAHYDVIVMLDCRNEYSCFKQTSLWITNAILPSISFPDDSLLWRHNGRGSVSNHQPHDCLLNRLFRRRSKKTSKLRVTGLCAGTSPVTGEFPAQMASNAENVSIWWRHHVQK